MYHRKVNSTEKGRTSAQGLELEYRFLLFTPRHGKRKRIFDPKGQTTNLHDCGKGKPVYPEFNGGVSDPTSEPVVSL